VSEFDLKHYAFDLPRERIAQFPVTPRDHSKLFVVNRMTKEFSHYFFYDLPELLPKESLLCANNSKVIRARLLGRRLLREEGAQSEFRRGGKVEFFLLEKKGDHLWEGLVKSSARVEKGFCFEVGGEKNQPSLFCEVQKGYSESQNGTVLAQFNLDPTLFGEVPLPPYISRTKINEDNTREDERTYQTTYAKREGSVAAPTAGLHFTERVFQRLNKENIKWCELTLHVGLGTFRPVKTQDIRHHNMHEEYYFIPEETSLSIQTAKKEGKKLGAVGTTSLRVLEGASHKNWSVGEGRTNLFIYPHGPQKIQTVDFLLTNFHLSESTLFMLVCSFAGTELMKKAYQEAIEKKYRFFSYGDAMLIL